MSDRATIVLCHPDHADPPWPDAELPAARAVEVVTVWDEDTIGVVGCSTGGWDALALAAEHPDLPRLVIVATPFEETPPVDLEAVGAKTLLLFGSKDPLTGSAHGRRWQKALPDARLEMVPGAGHDLLPAMWKRVLSHLAPGRRPSKPGNR